MSGEADDVHDRLWTLINDDNPLPKKGYTTNLNRFFGCIKTARAELSQRAVKSFVFEHAAIEADMLIGQVLRGKLIAKPQPWALDDTKRGRLSTDSARLTIVDKTLKSACQNALLVLVMMLADRQNRRLTTMTEQCSAPVERWNGIQSQKLRNDQAPEQWLLAQFGGDFMSHVYEILGCLSSPETVLKCGFKDPVGLEIALDEDELHVELVNECAFAFDTDFGQTDFGQP